MLDSNPLKSRILVPRLAVWGKASTARPDVTLAWGGGKSWERACNVAAVFLLFPAKGSDKCHFEINLETAEND